VASTLKIQDLIKVKTEKDYEYGDLIVLTFKGYTNLKAGSVGIIKSKYSHVANVIFPDITCSLPYAYFRLLGPNDDL